MQFGFWWWSVVVVGECVREKHIFPVRSSFNFQETRTTTSTSFSFLSFIIIIFFFVMLWVAWNRRKCSLFLHSTFLLLSAVLAHIFAFYINLFFSSTRHIFFDFIRYSFLTWMSYHHNSSLWFTSSRLSLFCFLSSVKTCVVVYVAANTSCVAYHILREKKCRSPLYFLFLGYGMKMDSVIVYHSLRYSHTPHTILHI